MMLAASRGLRLNGKTGTWDGVKNGEIQTDAFVERYNYLPLYQIVSSVVRKQ